MLDGIELDGTVEEYHPTAEGSRHFQRVVDGVPVGPRVWVHPDRTFAETFARAHEEPPRLVPKSVIVSRLIEAGKIAAAYQALNSKPEYWARWVASDRPAINYDDPDALALLKAIGADPAVILAP